MSVKGMVINAKSAIESLRDLIGTTRQTKSSIADQLSQAESERRSLLSAPLCRADLEAVLLRDIALQQAAALQNGELAMELAYTQSRNIRNQVAGNAASSSMFMTSKFNQSVLDRLVWAMGDPAEILKRLKPAIDRIDFKNAGPALEERKAKIATLDKTIAGLRADLAEIEAVLSNTDPNVRQDTSPRPGERREIAPGEWATWAFMPNQKEGFWNFDSRPVVLRAAPNQPFN